MYDTIKLKSPVVDEYVAENVTRNCIRRTGLDIKTGELLYNITTGSLKGSWDNNISIRVNEDIFGYRIIIEASVHKALMGHNIYGGPKNIKKSCIFLVSLVEDLIQFNLPNALYWELCRADVSEVYKLPSLEAVQEWFHGVNASSYPRRSVNRYGNTGVYVQGQTSTLKFYAKGVEFNKHDRLRLKRFLDEQTLYDLRNFANKILRVELEVKSKKLKYDFNVLPLVKDLEDSYFNNLHDLEVNRFLKEGVSMLVIVNSALDVKCRLYDCYKPALAGTLLGTWYQLTTLGEESVKKTMSKPTYYRHIRYLKDAAVSWNCTDVILSNKHSLIPSGFSPTRSNSNHLDIEDSLVQDNFKKYDIA